MYEQPKIRPARKPLRAAHAPATPVSGLRGQLAGHLAALLDVTRELHTRTGDPAMEDAAAAIGARISELGPQLPPRAAVAYPSDLAALHSRAFDLAGRVLVVSASQQDTRTAILACRRMDVHTAARESLTS